MSIVSQFFDKFKHKDINKVTGAENNTAEDNESPLVVQANRNAAAMVRADDFKESSVEPEEYTVKEDDEEEVEYLEDRPDVGITVNEGDDMSPIIVNADEIEANAEVIYHMFDDDNNKSDVVEYPINIRNNESEEEDIEIL